PQRDLLMVGNWPRGEVNFYRLSTLKRLRFTVRTGRYLRNFAYDEERGFLFCASLCGVYMVDVGKLLREER
ncbi:MAG: hypothetical protein ABIH66_09165, partial [bacterium]